jgi:ribose-phosphate pyrophosphokinase
MILYSIPELKYLIRDLKKYSTNHYLILGKSQFSQFINGEWHAKILENVSDKECAILGSLTPPTEQLLKTLILIHTLKKEGAKRIVLVLPYFAYTRHDKNKKNESLVTDLIYKLLTSVGVDKIITVDIHSRPNITFTKIPILNVLATELFLDSLTKNDLKNITIIAPDEGAKERSADFRKTAGITKQIAYFKKIRTNNKIRHTKLVGKISDSVILIDDILDTGFTLISCVKLLKKLGVKKIIIAVTHGLFMGEQWDYLFQLGVSKIITTDSVATVLNIKNKKIKVISCAPLLAKALKPKIL